MPDLSDNRLMPVHTELCYEHEIATECLLHNGCRHSAYITPLHYFQQTLAVLIGHAIRVLYNARNLKANLDHINDTLRELEYKFHIIAISETWFKENNWDGN